MSFRFFRRFFYEIHLWLGIVSGIILFVVCLTGTIIVFREDVRNLVEPAKYYVAVPKGNSVLAVDDLIAKVEAARPMMKMTYLALPEQPNRTVRMLLAPTEKGGGKRGMVYADPYTGNIVGEGGANPFDPFFQSMVQLHRFLWLPIDIGRPIVGIATIIFIVIYLSGVILWLPRTWKAFAKWKAWKIGFLIRFRKGVWPLVYDLHNTIGFYLLVPSLILALTGLCWSFSWYRDAASNVLGDQIFKRRTQLPPKIEPVERSAKPFSVGEMIARQNELTPGPGEITVSIPLDNKTAMEIQKGRTGFFSLNVKDKTLWDHYRGTVIPVEHHGKMVEVERFADKPFGAKIVASIRKLHIGNITGTSSKIVFFITCLFLTSFPLSGVALWIKKLRTKYKRRRMQSAESVVTDT
jgi:uncharacterized iron-regulated membrane protein